MTDEAGALWMPVPSENVFPGYWGNTPRYVVIHKTASAGTAQDIARFFQTAPDKRSSHYIVGTDGAIVQCVSEADGAGANCCLETGHASFLPQGINLNLLTISIEHCDAASDNSTPLTDAQKLASFRLVHDICQRHGIPMRPADGAGGILGHRDISPQSRALCPNNYPWDELFTHLQKGNGPMVPAGWTDNGSTLTAPNGHRVVLGFRSHILHAASWDAGNQPQEEEYHTDQVLLHNSSIGGGQRQAFRDCLLWFTDKQGVVQEPYLGLEIDAAYNEIASLQAQLAKLQQPTPNNSDVITQLRAIQTAIAAALKDLGA